MSGRVWWEIGPHAGGRRVDLDRPRVMAIINATPDSFSDGGECLDPAAALARMRLALDEGADLIDIGGESTRPGAARVGAEEQTRRVIPVIRAARRSGITAPISIDTTRAETARAALDAGADIINDVSAGTEDAGLLALAAERGAGIILMHRLRPPEADVCSDRYAQPPAYDADAGGVTGVVRAFLAERAQAAMNAGVRRAAIVLDPGLGFGKSVEQNFELLRRTRELIEPLGFPMLSGASRKSFIGRAVGEPVPALRGGASAAVSVAHCLAGVRLFRVHDVAEHVRALRVAARILGIGEPGRPLEQGGGE